MPLISVLLPVYNGGQYLYEAVESTLAQSFSDFELLILNDGSTDNSSRVLQELETRDQRIRVISRENRGLNRSLNELVLAARGQYLARMDQDDVCMPSRFQRQIEFLESHPDHVAVGGWIMQMNEVGLPIGIIKSPCEHTEIDGANLKGYCSVWHPTAFMRKDAMVAVEGYRDEYDSAADLDLWLRLAEIGKIANVPEIVLRYRLHAGSTSQLKIDAQRASAERACSSAWQRRGTAGHYEALDPWRPSGDEESLYKFILQYGWTAWNHGYRQTWRAYVKEALCMRPFSSASWKLFILGFLKRPV
jgi:glycosyltransferase involved in cell wall biosynthesis